MQKNFFLNSFVGILKVSDENRRIRIRGSGSISQRHGSVNTDPDPHQNVMDPQHCLIVKKVIHFQLILKDR
jgi:hypothetical protein